MEILFSPWRHAYVTSAKEEGEKCVLCAILESRDDEANLVLHRTALNYVLINRYPYNSGHLMIVPNRHAAHLHTLTAAERSDLIELAGASERILSEAYRAQGINLGINVGVPAGAGIEGHLHLHLVPRWAGDTNFMSVVGQTRVIPEEVGATYTRLRPLFGPGAGP